MDQKEIVPYLPPEIIHNILSRIPIKTVFSCKCACKSWLDLLKTPEFIRDHLSNSLPRLLFRHASKKDVFSVIEIEESFKIDCKHIKYKTLLELDIVKILNLSDHSGTTLEGSANGLIFLRNASEQSSNHHFICNPVTRECLKLPEPEGIHPLPSIVCYGFGRSRSSNQYKVVRILHDIDLDPDWGILVSIPKSVCQVYTLGTGSWRTIATPPDMFLDFGFSSPGKTFNGKIYWSARDVEHSCLIACFDLETEAFTWFQPPTVESDGDVMEVGILQNRLCLCDNTSKSKLCVYLMSGDGDGEERSWKKAHVVSKIPAIPDDVFRDVKVLEGGDVLMASANFCLICLSPTTKTVEPVVIFSGDAVDVVEAVSYTPSLISLKDFEAEDAKVSEFAYSLTPDPELGSEQE